MTAELPSFRYHPDPVATGVIERRDRTCPGCGQVRGWVYVVAPYAEQELRERLCPWCIADGTAAERFSARFTVLTAGDVPDGVSAEVVAEVAERTPGFAGWQQERWLFHCGDAAAYLGPVGWDELDGDDDAIAALVAQAEAMGLTGDLAEAFVGSLDVDGAATAYRFRCLHCDRSLAYADLDDE